MRLNMRILAGIVVIWAMALSLPAKTKDDSEDEGAGAKKPGKLSHLFMFHKSSNKEYAEAKPAAPKARGERHADAFPEPHKRGPENQPQTTNSQWADDTWKTSRNKDTFKQIEKK
jgi:hypothetical protein